MCPITFPPTDAGSSSGDGFTTGLSSRSYAHHFQVIRCPQFSPRFEILAKVKVLFRLLWLALTNCTIVSQILHRNGWVHRDISYGNIMLDERGHTRLIDFEFAKKIRDLDVPEFRVVSVRFYSP